MIVVDTHVWLWFEQGSTALGGAARRRIEAELEQGRIWMPAIGIWEVAMLAARGRIRMAQTVPEWAAQTFDIGNLAIAPLLPAIAARAAALDWTHRDPADRMIVATAQHWQAPLLTADQPILDYAAAGHVEAIDARR